MKTSGIVEKLQQDLLAARKERDAVAVATLQSVLARITNAEAVALPNQQAAMYYPASVPGTGVGSTEVARKELSTQEVIAIIQAEIQEIHDTVASLSAQPDHPYTAELRQKAALLSRYV